MLPIASAAFGLVVGVGPQHKHLRGTPCMTADRWLAGAHDRLPLLHMPLAKMLLPGETSTLHIKHAEELAALEATEDNTIGCLLLTSHGNCLAHTSLLEIRDVRRRDIGVDVEVLLCSSLPALLPPCS
jgi:hypothetical protein